MEAFTASEGDSRPSGSRGGPRLLRLQNDERLVELLREGDEAAFEAIVARYRARLFGFCRKMLGSPQDAEDVLQEVLANAYRAMLADCREIQLRPWLFRIARNRCLNHLQRLRPVLAEQERLERIPAGEGSEARELSCAQIRLQIEDTLQSGEKMPGPARRHVRGCEGCREFAGAVGADSKAVAALSPLGMLAALKHLVASKIGGSGAGATAGGAGSAAAGGGLAAGAGLGGWATGSKLAAATVAVVVVAAGAGGIAGSRVTDTADQIAPAVSGTGQPTSAAPAPAAPSAGSDATSPSAPNTGEAPPGETTPPAEVTVPGQTTTPELPGAYVVPPSTYPDGGGSAAPGETTTTTPAPVTGHETTTPAQP